MEIRYIKTAGAILKRRRNSRPGKQMLLGARLHVDTADIANGLIRARTVPDTNKKFYEGFIKETHLSIRQQLKERCVSLIKPS